MKTARLIIIFLLTQLNFVTAQNVIFKQVDTLLIKNIRLEISSDKATYKTGEDIFINYKFTNISDSIQKVMIRDYWGFPMGMGIMITNSNDSSICKYPSRHILSSQIYTEKQLKAYYKKLKAKEIIEGQAKLQDIPVFKDFITDKTLPQDTYNIRLTYIWLISNTIRIDVK